MPPQPPGTPVGDVCCPLCGAQQARVRLYQAGYRIVACRQCSAQYVSPTPPPEALHAHYHDPAYFAGTQEQGYADYAAMEKAMRPHFRRRLHTLAHALHHAEPGGRLLDFGCAAGFFLKLAREEGWQIAGVELAQPMAQQASQSLGIAIASSLPDLDRQHGDSARSFDAITLWEVIEHLPDPLNDLRDLHSRLRPGGVLMLSTPNTDHWQAHRTPAAWQGYRPPSHLLFFTPATLHAALQQAGFQSIHIQRTAPLPPLPPWLEPLSRPVQHKLATGELAPGWPWQTALWLWRGVRVGALGWQKLVRPQDDIFTTLEAVAVKR